MSDPTTNPTRPAGPWYGAAVGTALGAGVFSLVVAGLLVRGHLRATAADPLDSPELAALKASLSERPRDEALKRQIRELDAQLRADYFALETARRRGAWLLLGGVVVTVAALQLAAAMRHRPHVPGHADDPERQFYATRAWASGGVAALGVALVGATVLAVAGMTGPAVVTVEAPTAGPTTTGEVETAAYVATPEAIRRNWPRFRGPAGAGVSAFDNAPIAWGGGAPGRIDWKTPVPLSGMSSPIVWDQRVFVTGAEKGRREIYGFDLADGKLLWTREIRLPGSPTLADDELWEDTGRAPSTPCTDGRGVFAIYPNGDLACVDFDGRIVWAQNLGKPDNMYGHATSLLVYDGRVIVQLDQATSMDGKSELIAYEAATGKLAWQVSRPTGGSWTSPIVAATPGGDQLVTSGDPWVIAYDPSNGGELWRAELMSYDVAPSPVFGAGLVFVVTDSASLFAIRPDGRGNVTESHVAWTSEDHLPSIPSPLCDGERLYTLTAETGTLACYQATTGKVLWTHSFDMMFNSSPSLVGDRVLLLAQKGTAFVVAAADEFKELSRSTLGEKVNTCPAFVEGRTVIRGDKHLFCIAGGTP